MNSGCKEISSIYFRIGFPLNLNAVIYNPDLKLKRNLLCAGSDTKHTTVLARECSYEKYL